MRRLLFSVLALASFAALPASGGEIAIYKGLIVTALQRRDDSGELKKSVEKSNGYLVISLPDGLKQSKVAFILPTKVGSQKLLRISPPPAFNLSLTGMIQATTEPIVSGAFVLSGAIDSFSGYTGVNARGALKAGMKEKAGADQEIPKTLAVGERYARQLDDSAFGFYERNGGVKLDFALSAAANAAGDDFEAAVERVKALFPSHTPANAL